MVVGKDILQQWSNEFQLIIDEYIEQVQLTKNDLLVIGCSTSEVMGEKIGTQSTKEVAQLIFDNLLKLQQKTNVQLAFQCCEHLNRALVISKETANKYCPQ